MKNWVINLAVAILLVFLPSATSAQEDVGRILSLLYEGDAAQSDSLASILHSLDDKNPLFAYLLSLTRYETGHYAEALQVAEKSLEHLPAVSSDIREKLLQNRNYLLQTVPLLSQMKYIEGRHFIFGYINRKDSLLVDEVFEVLESAYDILGQDLGYRPQDKIRVEAYPDRGSFIQSSTLSEDEVNRTGTIALCKFNRILFISPRALLQGYTWKPTLCHEYTHFIINRASKGRLPLWLHEAMAHFEEVRYTGKPAGNLTLVEKDLLYRAAKYNRFVSLSKMYPSMAKLKDGEESGTAFAEVLMAMGMIHSNGGYPGMQSLLKICADNGNLDSALGGLENFEKRLFTYIREKNFEPVEGVSIVRRTFLEDTTADESFLFRKYLRIAELLLEKHRTEATIKEMERADESGKQHSPWILNQIGLLLEKSGEPGKAGKIFNRSIMLFPEYGNGYFNRGMNANSQGNIESALADLKTVLDINPFHLPARKLYAEILDKQGMKQESRKQKRMLELVENK